MIRRNMGQWDVGRISAAPRYRYRNKHGSQNTPAIFGVVWHTIPSSGRSTVIMPAQPAAGVYPVPWATGQGADLTQVAVIPGQESRQPQFGSGNQLRKSKPRRVSLPYHSSGKGVNVRGHPLYYTESSAGMTDREKRDSMKASGKRYILIAMFACAFSASAFAQGMALPPGIAAETKQVYTAVKNNLIAAADAMPEASYSFAPVPEEMTFGGWVAHVADAQTGICSTLNGQTRRGDAATKTTTGRSGDWWRCRHPSMSAILPTTRSRMPMPRNW